MGSGRWILIYQPKMAFHQLPVAVTGCGMSIWSSVVKEGTGGKVISLNRVTQRSQTRRREFMGEERRLQGALRLEKGRLWTSRRAEKAEGV